MKSAILIGNGFTLNLIKEYTNSYMLEKFREKDSSLLDKANNSFAIFRELSRSDNDVFSTTEALFLPFFPGDNVFPSDDKIIFDSQLQKSILRKLQKMGFDNSKEILNNYFLKYGLIYDINKKELCGIENILKTVDMFKQINVFTVEEYEKIEKLANEIYYNNGNNGLSSINKNNYSVDKLVECINRFDYVFTTNYDTILDDILEKIGKKPFHLHGGFCISHPNREPDGRYGPNEAFLVWGINGESKYKKLNCSVDFSNTDFSAFRFGGNSQLGDYFDCLKNEKYEEIFILGFSGENDEHINSIIKSNKNLKRIIYYTNPSKVNDKDEIVRIRILFKGFSQQLKILSWNDFWDVLK